MPKEPFLGRYKESKDVIELEIKSIRDSRTRRKPPKARALYVEGLERYCYKG
jgi:hypothetical protein